TSVALALLLVIAAALLTHVSRMLLGPAPAVPGGEHAAGAAPPSAGTERAAAVIDIPDGGVATLARPAIRTTEPARPGPNTPARGAAPLACRVPVHRRRSRPAGRAARAARPGTASGAVAFRTVLPRGPVRTGDA